MVSFLKNRFGNKAIINPAPWTLDADENQILQTVRPYTMSDGIRLSNLYALCREIVQDRIPGDVVECGVCNGGTAAMMAAALKAGNPVPRLWLYDTFEGIPAAGPQDPSLAHDHTGDFVGSLERVQEVLEKVQFPRDRVVVRQGRFEDTFAAEKPTQVALLNVDGDWYESVLLTLRAFYPMIPAGGYIVLDDFGHWEGARRAFYHFCREQEIEPLLERMGYTQAFWRKGAEHTRDTMPCYEQGVYRPRIGDADSSG